MSNSKQIFILFYLCKRKLEEGVQFALFVCVCTLTVWVVWDKCGKLWCFTNVQYEHRCNVDYGNVYLAGYLCQQKCVLFIDLISNCTKSLDLFDTPFVKLAPLIIQLQKCIWSNLENLEMCNILHMTFEYIFWGNGICIIMHCELLFQDLYAWFAQVTVSVLYNCFYCS